MARTRTKTELEKQIELLLEDNERLMQTKRAQRGQLKKQGAEIVSLRRERDRFYSRWQLASKYNAALLRHTGRQREILWGVAGLLDPLPKTAQILRAKARQVLKNENRKDQIS